MARFIVRRLLWMIPSILIVTFLVYVACRIGFNPVAAYSRANPRASDEKIDQFIETNGLYPGVRGYIRGYFEWLGKFMPRPESEVIHRTGQIAVDCLFSTPNDLIANSPH